MHHLLAKLGADPAPELCYKPANAFKTAEHAMTKHPLALSLILGLAGMNAHAATSSSSASVSGAVGTKDGIPVVCTDGGGAPAPICLNSMLDGTTGSTATVLGSYSAPGASFTARASASSTAPTELHAVVELTASGGPSRAEEIWRGRASVSTMMDLIVAPTSPADVGMAVDLTLTYRFDGSLVQTGTNVLSVSANVMALGFPDSFSNGVSCVPDGAGHCNMPVIHTTYGSTFTFGALLQTTAEIRVIPSSPLGYSANAVADYSHTLGLVGATLRDSKGNVLAGWSLEDADTSAVLVSSPVPEPGSWALMLAGLVGLAGLSRASGLGRAAGRRQAR